MLRFLILIGICAIVLEACASAGSQRINIQVFKSPTWGCCGDWVKYLEENGFDAIVEDVQDISLIKSRYHVPSELQSCHTAIVDGYVIEGHVPVREIYRLLNEHPDIIGLAVAGMPSGSPGMGGGPPEPFDVIAFDALGIQEIFASYP